MELGYVCGSVKSRRLQSGFMIEAYIIFRYACVLVSTDSYQCVFIVPLNCNSSIFIAILLQLALATTKQHITTAGAPLIKINVYDTITIKLNRP